MKTNREIDKEFAEKVLGKMVLEMPPDRTGDPYWIGVDEKLPKYTEDRVAANEGLDFLDLTEKAWHQHSYKGQSIWTIKAECDGKSYEGEGETPAAAICDLCLSVVGEP